MAPPRLAPLPAQARSSNVKPNYGTVPTTQEYHRAHKDEEALAAVPAVALDAAAIAAAALQIDAPSPTTPKRGRWVPGWTYLVLFVLLYSANNAVLAGLMAKGCVGFLFCVCVLVGVRAVA